MNSIDFIIKSLKDLHDKFVHSNMRYEFLPNLKSHLIEITPIEFYESEDYIDQEMILEENFKNMYFDEDIVFITNDSLNKIENPILEIYGEKTGIFRSAFSELLSAKFIESSFYSGDEVCFASNEEFALAA